MFFRDNRAHVARTLKNALIQSLASLSATLWLTSGYLARLKCKSIKCNEEIVFAVSKSSGILSISYSTRIESKHIFKKRYAVDHLNR